MVIVPGVASTCPVLSNCTGPTRLWLIVEGGGPKYERPTFVPIFAGAGNRSQPGCPLSRAKAPNPCSELNPNELSATSTGAVDFATGRFPRRCRAIDSLDMHGLAATVDCASDVDGARPLITAALAKMSSLAEENMRDRRADTLSSFPRGKDLRRAGSIDIVELLGRMHDSAA